MTIQILTQINLVCYCVWFKPKLGNRYGPWVSSSRAKGVRSHNWKSPFQIFCTTKLEIQIFLHALTVVQSVAQKLHQAWSEATRRHVGTTSRARRNIQASGIILVKCFCSSARCLSCFCGSCHCLHFKGGRSSILDERACRRVGHHIGVASINAPNFHRAPGCYNCCVPCSWPIVALPLLFVLTQQHSSTIGVLPAGILKTLHPSGSLASQTGQPLLKTAGEPAGDHIRQCRVFGWARNCHMNHQEITLVYICRIRMRLYVIKSLNDIYMSNNF